MIPSYRSTLDRLTFVDVEVRVTSYGILGKFSRGPTKLGYMCKALKKNHLELHSNNTVCGMLLGVKSKTNCYFTIF